MANEVHDEFRRMVPQPTEPVARCPVCGSRAEVWEFSEKVTDPIQRVVMCEKGDDFGPRSGLAYCGCLLYMPPPDFYCGTGRDAVRYWNSYAAAVYESREQNSLPSYPAHRSTGG